MAPANGIGNTLGVFFSPLLNLMFASAPGWGAGLPIANDGSRGLTGLPEIYRRVMMKMGLAMFVPMVRITNVDSTWRAGGRS